MKKNFFFVSILSLLVFLAIFGYSLVFGISYNNSIIPKGKNPEYKANLLDKNHLYLYYIDLPNNSLKNIKKDLVNKTKDKSNLERYNEAIYKKEIVNNILKKRTLRYGIPILGYSLPNLKNKSKLPNGPRPYRDNYTISIHQGWDIDANSGTIVSSLSDGIIIRIVNNYSKNNLLKVDYGENLEYNNISPKIDKKDLTYEEKIKNLDILRGNQVWLKTMKGDVVFYSHLNEIFSNIKEGEFIKYGTNIGTVGKTGVPGDDYKDYHLHFEIHKNPYNEKLAGKYKIEDYLKWDWYFKGKSIEYIVENQGKVFDLK